MTLLAACNVFLSFSIRVPMIAPMMMRVIIIAHVNIAGLGEDKRTGGGEELEHKLISSISTFVTSFTPLSCKRLKYKNTMKSILNN